MINLKTFVMKLDNLANQNDLILIWYGLGEFDYESILVKAIDKDCA